MGYKKTEEKLDTFIRHLIDEKTAGITDSEMWTKVRELEKRIEQLEKELTRGVGLMDMIWNLPMFKQYRSK
jgi:hypothetical protein